MREGGAIKHEANGPIQVTLLDIDQSPREQERAVVELSYPVSVHS